MVKSAVKETGFVVEKIIDKRITPEGKIEYYIKWRGYPSSENTWEPEENCDCPAMIQKFEESRAKSKKRGEKKPKVEEIQKPRGYERGLAIEQIVGATDVTGSVSYLVKWQFCDELDLVPGAEVRQKNPEFVIDFFERRSPYQRVINERLLGVPDELRIINGREGVVQVPAQTLQGEGEAMGTTPEVEDEAAVAPAQDTEHDNSGGAIDSAAVSYSIPVPGVGHIGIDVPILQEVDMQ